MTTQVKSITLRATYEGDMRGLNDDVAKLKSIGRNLQRNNPFRIRPSLDLGGIKADAQRAAKTFTKEFQSAMGKGLSVGGTVSKGGIIIPASAAGSLKDFATANKAAFKQIANVNKDGTATVVKSFEQLQAGIAKVTSFDKLGKNGKSKIIDTRPIADFKAQLAAVEREFAGRLGSAKGNKSDVATLLEEKQKRIAAVLNGKGLDAVRNTSVFSAAEKSLDRLEERIAKTRGTQNRSTTNDQRKDFNRRTDSFITRQNNELNRNVIKSSKQDEAAAGLITNRAVREQEINRVLVERERILAAQVAQYRKLEEVSKTKGFTEAAGRYRNAGNGIEGQLNQVRLDRSKFNIKNTRVESESDLQRRLQATVQLHKVERDQLKLEEDRANKLTNRRSRERSLGDISARRGDLHSRTERDVSGIHQEARTRGLFGVESSAKSHLSRLDSTGINDMRRLANATNQSGHAFNFHSNALLKNASTFVKWYVPAQLAMGAFNAIGSGIGGAIEAQRTFKILGAVYQGTAEEAKHLADQTLMLAAANGRDSTEAAQSVVAWARLGLTRSQALMAVETSLRAANVAEVSAAEATSYLTANYKAFGQTIEDIPATLDYINSLSNKNAVAPKVIFEGLSRSAKVAADAGLSFKELAGIIATVSATTQRPGPEIGNSIKSIINRVRTPEVAGDLKAEFGIDIKDATGDAKNMNQILGELAGIYPGLNKSEKARLGNLVAGNLQGNRFAVIMKTWNESLIAQAAAGLDANSAMRENAQILDSIDAKLTKLGVTGTRFFHTLGEAGAFDFFGNLIDDAGTLIDLLARIGGATADALPGGGGGGLSPLNKRLSMVEYYASGMSTAGARISDMVSGDFSSLGTYQTDDEAKYAAKQFQKSRILGGIGNSIYAKSLNDGSGPLAKSRLSTLASDTIQSQNKVEALGKAQQYFSNASVQFGGKGVDIKQSLQEFDKALEDIFPKLEGSTQEAARLRLNLRPLLEGGDVEGGRRGLADVANNLQTRTNQEFANSETLRLTNLAEADKTVQATRDHIKELYEALSQEPDTAVQKILKTSIDETNSALKEQETAVSRMRDQFSKPVADPLAPFKERLDAFIEDTKVASGVFGELLSTLGSTGFSTLDSKLKLGGALLERNALGQTLDATRRENEGLNATDQASLDRLNASRITGGIQDNSYAIDPAIAGLQRKIDGRNAVEDALGTRFNELDKATPEIERKNELERQSAELKNVYEDARTRTQSGLARYEVGPSEGARLSQRTFGSISQLRGDVGNPNLGSGNATQDVEQLGALTERLAQSKQGLAGMEDRMNRALAERVNLEGDIAEASRKQTEELSKRLMLAGREDQLRTAAASAFLRGSGRSQFSQQEFQYFSSETRNAISSYNPRSVQGLDDTEKDNNESRGKLDSEISGLRSSIKMLTKDFDDLRPKAETKGAGLIDSKNPFGRKPPTGSDIVNPDKNEIRMNLNTGPINVNLDFSQQVQALKDAIQIPFDAKMSALLADVKRTLAGNAGPNTGAAAGAF